LDQLNKVIGIDALNPQSNILHYTQIPRIQDFLVSLSLITKPSEYLFDSVKNLIENDDKIPDLQLKEKALLTIGSLVNLIKNNDNPTIIKNYLDLIDKESRSKNKFNNFHLESLRNSKLDISFDIIQNLLDNQNFSIAAIKSLNNFKKLLFEKQTVLDKLVKILNQDAPYQNISNDIRAESLSLLLDKYTSLLCRSDTPILANILLKLQNESYNMRKSDQFLYYSQRLFLEKMTNDAKIK
jgi:hypothetical protein